VNPHVRGAFPWLRSGPLWRFDTSQAQPLSGFLAAESYARLDLDGAAVVDRASAHAQLARLFDFPDWYGGNWDAFHDCFHGWVSDHDGERVALVWHDLDVSARQAPATTTEVGWALLDEAFEHRWSTEGRPTVWLEVFALGSGPDFDRPATG
jgi:RNAse (barnase) inhibitor barstar